MEILRCEGLTKIYGSGGSAFTALDGLDLSVDKGELVAVVGASGSGKSTLLHIIGTVEKPSSGRVLVEGQDLCALNASQAAVFRRRRVGLIYQFYNLVPTLTVERNILLPLLLDKRAPDAGLFDTLTERLGLTDKLDCLPGQLSGGQQQRAAVARALLYRPALLLADEPTGNLDSKNSRELLALLKDFNRSLEQTVLLITHDLRLAAQADRVISLEDGRIVDDKRQGS